MGRTVSGSQSLFSDELRFEKVVAVYIFCVFQKTLFFSKNTCFGNFLRFSRKCIFRVFLVVCDTQKMLKITKLKKKKKYVFPEIVKSSKKVCFLDFDNFSRFFKRSLPICISPCVLFVTLCLRNGWFWRLLFCTGIARCQPVAL